MDSDQYPKMEIRGHRAKMYPQWTDKEQQSEMRSSKNNEESNI